MAVPQRWVFACLLHFVQFGMLADHAGAVRPGSEGSGQLVDRQDGPKVSTAIPIYIYFEVYIYIPLPA